MVNVGGVVLVEGRNESALFSRYKGEAISGSLLLLANH